MSQDSQKRVDESWKEAVQKEKAVPAAEAGAPGPPEADFLGFVSTLAMQALIALGEVAHPESQEKHEDLPQAHYLIDVIQLLSDKTKGNLLPQETDALKNLLYELKIKYVKKNREAA